MQRVVDKKRAIRGVYTLEMAIVIPLFIALVLAIIDLCQISAQRTLLIYALHSAGRAASLATNNDNAQDQAQDNFKQYLKNHPITGSIFHSHSSDNSTSFVSPLPAKYSVGGSCICGMILTMNAEVSCNFFCRPLVGIGQAMGNNGKQPLVINGFYPFEDQNSCVC